QANSSGQESEGLDQTLNVRVFTAIALEREPGGNLGILFGKLGAHLAHESQFTFVIAKQFVAHLLNETLAQVGETPEPCLSRFAPRIAHFPVGGQCRRLLVRAPGLSLSAHRCENEARAQSGSPVRAKP